MNFKIFNKLSFHIIFFLSILIVAILFFYRKSQINFEMVYNYHYIFNYYYLIISFFITFIAFLMDTYILQICINNNEERKKISFLRNMAILNTSNIYKYIPGFIWGYAAQILWFSKKGISKYNVLYTNFICCLGAVIVSIFLGIMYAIYYFPRMEFRSDLMLIAFFILDLLFIFYNAAWVNFLIRIVNSYFGREIQTLHMPKYLLISIQLAYLIQWHLIGLGGYFLTQGIGLKVPFINFYAIMTSMSFSWLIGYLSILAPGGLGVREGVMYLMLNNITDAQTSLIVPIATRLLYLLVELSLGLVGFLLAVKFRFFSQTLEVDLNEK